MRQLRLSYDNRDTQNDAGKKSRLFQAVLETRITELQRALAAAEREARTSAAKHADPADQAASEYDRQALAHKAASMRQTLTGLRQALKAL